MKSLLIAISFVFLSSSFAQKIAHPDAEVGYNGQNYKFYIYAEGVVIHEKRSQREEFRRWNLGKMGKDFFVIGEESFREVQTGFCELDITERTDGFYTFLYSYTKKRRISFRPKVVSIEEEGGCMAILFDFENSNSYSITPANNDRGMLDLLYEITE